MALKDRFLRAVGRSNDSKDDRSSISSSSTGGKRTGTTTPTNGTATDNIAPLTTVKTAVEPSKKPEITLTKTHSRLGKTLTWHSSSGNNSEKKSKQEIAKDKQIKQWAKVDDVEWTSPMSQRPGRKDQGCQNTLRAFDFQKAALGHEDRQKSVCSGVSPSRGNSIDEGLTLHSLNAKRHSSGAVGPGKLSQELSRDDKENNVETSKPAMVGVREE